MKTIYETIYFMQLAHKGISDMGGKPYWLHPYGVYTSLGKDATESEKYAALLHDVVEDTEYTYEDLLDMGYTTEIIDIIRLITKEDDDYRPYHVWIQSIIDSGNISAIKVKKADMAHNTLPERLVYLDAKTRTRMEKKYKLGWAVLMEYEKGI